MSYARFGRAFKQSSELMKEPEWCTRLSQSAKAHGGAPYVVEGFEEINAAVKRGHAVLVRRECAEVADGVTVFADASIKNDQDVAAILKFDINTAQFVLQNAHQPTDTVSLTPRRLATYLSDPERSFGVALGA